MSYDHVKDTERKDDVTTFRRGGGAGSVIVASVRHSIWRCRTCKRLAVGPFGIRPATCPSCKTK